MSVTYGPRNLRTTMWSPHHRGPISISLIYMMRNNSIVSVVNIFPYNSAAHFILIEIQIWHFETC